MHAGHDAIGLEHEVAASRRRDCSRVVGKAERAGMLCERREIARDEALLAGLRRVASIHRHPAPKQSIKGPFVVPIIALATSKIARQTGRQFVGTDLITRPTKARFPLTG